MSSDAAVALALDVPEDAADGGDAVSLAPAGGYEVAPSLPSTLTPREREVVALIASGRSNKAIAEELYISPATAARHVANILAKLGFRSRAQVAAWAAEKQLDSVGSAARAASARRA